MKPSITIIGNGNVGRALATALKKHGYRVDVVRRGSLPRRAADILWLCVPDKAIASVARTLATALDWTPRIAVHASGALPAAVLAPLKKRGAAVVSAHPLNTFVAAVRTDLRGVPFTLEGDAAAIRFLRPVMRNLNHGGPILQIAARQKPLYHAMGAFASPLLIALLANAELIGKKAGVADPRRALAAILRTTIQNYERWGAAASFSGPIVRGDLATVRKHLRALADMPRQRAVYRALAASALELLPSKIKTL